jgi:hypothetical protein
MARPVQEGICVQRALHLAQSRFLEFGVSFSLCSSCDLPQLALTSVPLAGCIFRNTCLLLPPLLRLDSIEFTTAASEPRFFQLWPRACSLPASCFRGLSAAWRSSCHPSHSEMPQLLTASHSFSIGSCLAGVPYSRTPPEAFHRATPPARDLGRRLFQSRRNKQLPSAASIAAFSGVAMPMLSSHYPRKCSSTIVAFVKVNSRSAVFP